MAVLSIVGLAVHLHTERQEYLATKKAACEARPVWPCTTPKWNEDEGRCTWDKVPDGPCQHDSPCHATCTCEDGWIRGEEISCEDPKNPCRRKICNLREQEGQIIKSCEGASSHRDGTPCTGPDNEEGRCFNGLCLGDGTIIAPRTSAWPE